MDNKNNETKEYTLTEEELNTVSGGASSQIPGISCPQCGKFIPTTITELLTHHIKFVLRFFNRKRVTFPRPSSSLLLRCRLREVSVYLFRSGIQQRFFPIT